MKYLLLGRCLWVASVQPLDDQPDPMVRNEQEVLAGAWQQQKQCVLPAGRLGELGLI